MPIAIDLPPDDEIWSIEQYVDHIERTNYDFAEVDDLLASAPYFQKLNNNKAFFLDRVFDELVGVADFQRQNVYGSQVFLLHMSERYFLRANVWRPMSRLEQSMNGFQYDVCHDHNFHILTAGYFGPGYRSRSYSYDRGQVVGVLGETAGLVNEGLFELPTGRLAIYRAKQDVHFQLPPESISISLNLIPRTRHIDDLQFQFDESDNRIVRYLQASGTELVVRMAGLMGDDSFLDPLDRIATSHPSTQVRALASVATCQIEPMRTEQVAARVSNTERELGRTLFGNELANYGYAIRPA